MPLGRVRGRAARERERRLRRQLHRDANRCEHGRAGRRHGLLRRRAASDLRLSREAVLRLRPLVLLGTRRDLPESALRRRRPGGREPRQHQPAGLPPALVRPPPRRRGRHWRWYTHEVFTTIWAIDRDYLPKTFDNVRPFQSPFSFGDFFSAAQAGTLPDVAWIDPNFVDLGGAVSSNDDHPPSDVRAEQELVLRVFNALVRSPAWERTLLVITYDEHGASSTTSSHLQQRTTTRGRSSICWGHACRLSSSRRGYAPASRTRSSTTHRSSRHASFAFAAGKAG